MLAWIALVTLGLGAEATWDDVATILAGCAALSATIFGGYALVFSTASMIRLYRRSRRGIECVLAAVFGFAGLSAFSLTPADGEPPRLGAEMITAILKAFLLLNDWLRQETRPRLLHRLCYGRDFPPAYMRQVLAAEYWPDLDDLMNDYLTANPTRNRDLDLLPLFLHFDEQRVRARLPNEKIGKRAVLHYRLPTARVSQPDWSIAPAWNRWVAVERLAADRPRVERLADAVYRSAR